MKLKVRRSRIEDLESIYDLQVNCFTNVFDRWYKSIISQYINAGIVIEVLSTGKIVGALLQGDLTACNREVKAEDSSFMSENSKDNYKPDYFEATCDLGKYFEEEQLYMKPYKGIAMICVDPEYRGKGLGKKLINKHFIDNKDDSSILCLHTRKSNINAFLLYKKTGYRQIAYVKNKYHSPNEDSIFMIKEL